MALGFHHAIVDWMDLGAWLIAGILLFVMVPVTLRWFALVIALTSLLIALFSDGGTDALFMPFLILAVWRWDRFATGRGAGLAGWIGPGSPGHRLLDQADTVVLHPLPRDRGGPRRPPIGPQPLAACGAVPRDRGRHLRARQSAVHHLEPGGVVERDAAPVHPPAGGRRSGRRHSRAARAHRGGAPVPACPWPGRSSTSPF